MSSRASLKIEKGIPLPPPSPGRLAGVGNRPGTLAYVLKRMEVGDSFAATGKTALAVYAAAKSAAPGAKFAVRKISDTDCSVWRVA